MPRFSFSRCTICALPLPSTAAVYAAKEVMRVLGILFTMWKTFHYFPKKAEKLAEVQAALNSPELEVTKPSDARWLAREHCVTSVHRSLRPLVETFEHIYDSTGDTEKHMV